MTWFTSLDKAVQRVIAWLMAAAALGVLLVVLGTCHNLRQAQERRAEDRVADAQTKAAEKAIDTQAQATKDAVAVDATTRNNQRDILNADNAKQDAGDAGRILRDGLCARRVYAGHPSCKR